MLDDWRFPSRSVQRRLATQHGQPPPVFMPGTNEPVDPKREAREVLRRADPEEPTGAPSPGEVEMADEGGVVRQQGPDPWETAALRQAVRQREEEMERDARLERLRAVVRAASTLEAHEGTEHIGEGLYRTLRALEPGDV